MGSSSPFLATSALRGSASERSSESSSSAALERPPTKRSHSFNTCDFQQVSRPPAHPAILATHCSGFISPSYSLPRRSDHCLGHTRYIIFIPDLIATRHYAIREESSHAPSSHHVPQAVACSGLAWARAHPLRVGAHRRGMVASTHYRAPHRMCWTQRRRRQGSSFTSTWARQPAPAAAPEQASRSRPPTLLHDSCPGPEPVFSKALLSGYLQCTGPRGNAARFKNIYLQNLEWLRMVTNGYMWLHGLHSESGVHSPLSGHGGP